MYTFTYAYFYMRIYVGVCMEKGQVGTCIFICAYGVIYARVRFCFHAYVYMRDLINLIRLIITKYTVTL